MAECCKRPTNYIRRSTLTTQDQALKTIFLASCVNRIYGMIAAETSFCKNPRLLKSNRVVARRVSNTTLPTCQLYRTDRSVNWRSNSSNSDATVSMTRTDPVKKARPIRSAVCLCQPKSYCNQSIKASRHANGNKPSIFNVNRPMENLR